MGSSQYSEEYLQKIRKIKWRPMNEGEKSAYRAQLYQASEDENDWKVPVFDD